MPDYAEMKDSEREKLAAMAATLAEGFIDTICKASFEDKSLGDGNISQGALKALSEAHDNKAALLQGTISGAFEAPLSIVVNESGIISTIAKMLMLSEDDYLEKITKGLEEEDFDAVNEIGAQIFSNIGVFLGKHLSGECRGLFEKASIRIFEDEELDILPSEAVVATYSFDQEGVVSFIMFDEFVNAALSAGAQGDSKAITGEAAKTEKKDKDPRERLQQLLNMEIPVSVVLAQKMVNLKTVLDLATGAIIEFDKNHEEPLDLLVSGKPIATGEAVKLGENFGIRIREVGSASDTLKKLR